MSMTVWHARNPRFLDSEPVELTEENFELVAIVEGNNPDLAYMKTNHVDNAWWENEGVELVGEPKHRSTSVGDVVVIEGVSFRCCASGWEVE